MAKVEQSIEVNVPVRTVYDQLTQFEHYPHFMAGVHSVHQLDDAHLHWHALKGGKEMEWNAEITEQVPDQCIAWRNTNGPRSEGRVSFESLGPDKTRIHLVMDADDAILGHAERAGNAEPAPDEDLALFKNMMEAQAQKTGVRRSDMHGETGDGQRNGDHAPKQKGTSAASANETLTSLSQAGSVMSRAVGDMRQTVRRSADRLTRDSSDRLAQPEPSSPDAALPQFWMPNMMQAWAEPFSVMRKMQGELDLWLDTWMEKTTNQQHSRHVSLGQHSWTPAVDVAEKDKQLIISADLPGIKKDEVRVEILGNQLIIEGERHDQHQQAQQTYQRSERQYGHFQCAIPLPDGIDHDSVRASLQDGVLEITLPIGVSDSPPTRVDIQPDHK